MGNVESSLVERARRSGSLALEGRALTAVPPPVWTLTALRTLDLAHNRLKALYVSRSQRGTCPARVRSSASEGGHALG